MILATIVLAATATTTIGPSPAADASEPLRAEIRSLLDADAAAWNRGDLDAFCSNYAEDALFVTPSGLTRGRRTVLDRYRAKYPDKAAMGTLHLEIVDLREAPRTDPKIAAAVTVAARWTLSYPDRPVASGWTLIVFHKIGARWLIVQDASM